MHPIPIEVLCIDIGPSREEGDDACPSPALSLLAISSIQEENEELNESCGCVVWNHSPDDAFV